MKLENKKLIQFLKPRVVSLLSFGTRNCSGLDISFYEPIKIAFLWKLSFDPKTCMQSHILGRGACQMSKGWRYTTQFKMEFSIENATFEQV